MTAWPFCWKAWWVISGNGSDVAHSSHCPHSSSSTNASEWRWIDPRFGPSLPVSHTRPFFHPSLLLFHTDLRSAPICLTSFSLGSLHPSVTPPFTHLCHSQNNPSKFKWRLWNVGWVQLPWLAPLTSSFTFSPFSVTFPLQLKVTLSSVALLPVSLPSLLEWYFGVPPTSFLMLYCLLYLPRLGGAFTPTNSLFPSPADAWFPLQFCPPSSFFFLFYSPTTFIPYPSSPLPLPDPSFPAPRPLRLSPSLSRVYRQLLSGKVTLCVISAFHGSPLSLQRVIISFRVKGSICYKRTRASGIEGARVRRGRKENGTDRVGEREKIGGERGWRLEVEMNEGVRQGGNEGGAAETFYLCCGQAVLRGWKVCEMGGVTSQLRLPLQSKITSPGRDTEAREHKRCPEKETEQLWAWVF